MRDRNRWMIQGATSGLVFATFAVIAGVLVDWPAKDVLSAGFVAFCGGTALEHFMRRHYGLAWIFIAAGLGLGFFMMHADAELKATVKDAAATVGSGTTRAPGDAGITGRRNTPKKKDEERAPVERDGSAAETPAAATIVQVRNPNAVPVSVEYEYPGGTLQLGGIAAEGSGTFEIPSTAPIELGTFAATYDGRTVRTRIFLRRGRTHQVDLPSIDR